MEVMQIGTKYRIVEKSVDADGNVDVELARRDDGTLIDGGGIRGAQKALRVLDNHLRSIDPPLPDE